MIAFVSNKQLAKKLENRPPEYIEELEACITKRVSTGIYIDTQSTRYKAMWKKYRDVKCNRCGGKGHCEKECKIPEGMTPELARHHILTNEGGCTC